MRIHQEKRHVPHAAEKMFALVAEMERYPEFLPFCERNVVRSRRMEAYTEVVISEMTIAFKVLRASFRSRVILDRSKRRILVESADGPLREFKTRWTFSPIDAESCDIEFLLTYEVASPTVAALLGSVLESGFSRFVTAFQQRAEAVYGRPAPAIVQVGAAAPSSA